MSGPITELILYSHKSPEMTSTLTAKIKENGDLVLEGYDLGKRARELFGDSDYEYWLTIPAQYKDTVLLWLIKERFETSSDFMTWLKDKGIPFEFLTW